MRRTTRAAARRSSDNGVRPCAAPGRHSIALVGRGACARAVAVSRRAPPSRPSTARCTWVSSDERHRRGLPAPARAGSGRCGASVDARARVRARDARAPDVHGRSAARSIVQVEFEGSAVSTSSSTAGSSSSATARSSTPRGKQQAEVTATRPGGPRGTGYTDAPTDGRGDHVPPGAGARRVRAAVLACARPAPVLHSVNDLTVRRRSVRMNESPRCSPNHRRGLRRAS